MSLIALFFGSFFLGGALLFVCFYLGGALLFVCFFLVGALLIVCFFLGGVLLFVCFFLGGALLFVCLFLSGGARALLLGIFLKLLRYFQLIILTTGAAHSPTFTCAVVVVVARAQCSEASITIFIQFFTFSHELSLSRIFALFFWCEFSHIFGGESLKLTLHFFGGKTLKLTLRGSTNIPDEYSQH